MEKAGSTARPPQNHACRTTLLQPDRRAAVLGQPSSLRPHFVYFFRTYDPIADMINAVCADTIQGCFASIYVTNFQLGFHILIKISLSGVINCLKTYWEEQKHNLKYFRFSDKFSFRLGGEQ